MSRRASKELTEAEVKLLQLRCRGMTVEQVGEAIYLSPNTIKKSLARIFRKLGAVNIAQAVQLAIHTGQLPSDPDALDIPLAAPRTPLRWADGDWHGYLEDPQLVDRVLDALARHDPQRGTA